MIYSEMTRKAMQIAYNAHHGQFDKSGIPYIFHPIHLAEQMDDEISCTVALLHDVVEDTDMTLDALKEIFPPEVTDALALLTHDDAADYFDYVRAIKQNPFAIKVKLADLAHNSDLSRLNPEARKDEIVRMRRAKYEKATKLLTEN